MIITNIKIRKGSVRKVKYDDTLYDGITTVPEVDMIPHKVEYHPDFPDI